MLTSCHINVLGFSDLNASACQQGADVRCSYQMPVGQICISKFLVVIVVVPSLLVSILAMPVLTQAAPLQLTGTLPAFMSTITSLVEMELESNKVHQAAVLNAAPTHMN